MNWKYWSLYVLKFFSWKNKTPTERRVYYSMAYCMLTWHLIGYLIINSKMKDAPKDPEERKKFFIQNVTRGSNLLNIRIDKNGIKMKEELIVRDKDILLAEGEP